MTTAFEKIAEHLGSPVIAFDRLLLKVGTLTVDVDAFGRGTVMVDGRVVACRGFRVDVRPVSLAKVELDLCVLPNDSQPSDAVVETKEGWDR